MNKFKNQKLNKNLNQKVIRMNQNLNFKNYKKLMIKKT